MNYAILISALGVLVSLLVSVFGGLAVVWKVGTLVGRTLSAIERFEDRSKAWDTQTQLVPLHGQRLDALERTVTDELHRIRSDLPPLRERLSSVSDEVEEIKGLQVGPRLAVVEKVVSNRGFQAIRPPPRPGIKREDDDV